MGVIDANAAQGGPDDITQLLRRHRAGDRAAFDHLVGLVYQHLRQTARGQLARGWASRTLDTTALVHEAYLRLVRQERMQWQSRTHFYAIAAQAMRRILVNYAEKRRAARRGGGTAPVPLDEALDTPLLPPDRIDEVLAVDQALQKLEAFNPRGCRVVEYRFFGGMTHDEIADVLGVSVITVRRAWTGARMWLRREIAPGQV